MSWYPVDESGRCVRVNQYGLSYEDFSCLYENSFARTYTSYEKEFNPFIIHQWMIENPWVPVTTILLYGLFILMGRSYFETRPPWNWRTPLAVWNLCLSIFSLMGFCRALPPILHNLYHYSVFEFFCFNPESSYGSDPVSGLWMQLFALSKFPELFDTVFIVVHKKPLIFLHWYHHISVLAYCWYSYVHKFPTGIIFCAMNYAVHAIMYFYYFLMAIKCKPKWFNSIYITVAQISQMVVGVIVTIMGVIIPPIYGKDCFLKKENNIAGMIMYGSYLLLFLQFFFKRYASVKKVKEGKSKKQK